MIEMNMHGGMGKIVMFMEKIGQPLGQFARMMVIDIDHRRYAVAAIAGNFRAFAYYCALQVAQLFRKVLVSPCRKEPVELSRELLVHCDGQTLHASLRY